MDFRIIMNLTLPLIAFQMIYLTLKIYRKLLALELQIKTIFDCAAAM